MSEPIIQIRNLTKIYESGALRVEALRGIDLSIPKGEVVSIMGRSGCGKTTLLNCASGLDGVNSGEVYIEGQNILKLKDKKRTKHRAQRMGFVFQFYNLLPVLNAVENVELPLLLIGQSPKKAREKALEMLGSVELLDWQNHKPAELSGGQRQRVTIARALVNDPAVVWADEPTGDLDDETSDEVISLFLELNQKLQQTIVMVTHDPAVAERTHRTIRMHSGKIVEDIVHQGK